MAISDLSVLISTEQDVQLTKKGSEAKDPQSTASDFFSLLQNASGHADTLKVKASRATDETKADSVEAKPNSAEEKLTLIESDILASSAESDDKVDSSGDAMLAHINAANSIDTRVNSPKVANANSIGNLLDRATHEKFDPSIPYIKAPRPIDDITPIIEPVPADDTSELLDPRLAVISGKTIISEAIDKQLNVKINKGPGDTVTPIPVEPIVGDIQEKGDAAQSVPVNTAQGVVNNGEANVINTTTQTAKAEPQITAIGTKDAPTVSAQVNNEKDELIERRKTHNSNQVETNTADNKSGLVLKEDAKPIPLDKLQSTASLVSENKATQTASILQSDKTQKVEVPNKDNNAADRLNNTSTDNLDKRVMTSNNLTNTAQEIKNQVASSSQHLVKEAAIADKAANILPSDIEIEKASKALLNSQSATEIKSNPVLANLTDEQRKTLQSQAAVIVEEGVTPAKLDTFKQYITELVNKNEKVAQNTVEKPLLMSQSEKVSKELDVAIGQLNNADKQALRTQLQQFLATAQPKGAALNNVTAVIDKLDQLHVAADTQKSEKVIPPQSAQVLNSTAASIVTNPEASKAQTSQEALIKSVTQEAVVKSETQQAVIKDALLESHNKEQVLPRESAVGRINQLFGQITGQVATLAAPIAESSEQRYQQEITDMQVLQAQQASPTSQTKQVNLDPTLLQALNIVKSDAAKLLQERVSALLSINNKEAEIRLDPPEMGSMQIRIRSDAEQAQINFVVQNQQAKEALEQSMPKLREMLAQQGIELGESSIEQGNSQNGSGADEQSQSSQHANNQQKNESESTLAEQNTRMSGQQSTSSIDYYA